ncbi:MAG: DUF4382 domain-containing protein [Chloroflexi bacterium]|nr:DUF4382 domain-containing protein [Chloroflexota bacterium]
MADKFDKILDTCIDRINGGERIEDCLADYPEHAQELEPLLKSMLLVTNAYSFVPRASAKQRAWQQLAAALRESDKRREKGRVPFPWFLGKAKAWAAAAVVIVIALGSYFGLAQVTSPGAIVSQPDPEGNFAFVISDAPNAIGDFKSLNLAVSKVGLQQQDGNWVEFVPETSQVDLTLLQGDMGEQVWRGNVPEGAYSAAVLHVTSTSGVLKDTGETVDIKLPGNKLHLNITFEVSADLVTEFVYDVTVISTGSGRYNLLPVVADSGTGKQIEKVSSQAQSQGQDQAQSQGQDQGQGQGEK